MTWTLLWDPVAARQVHKLDPMTQKRIIRKAVDLGLDPHPKLFQGTQWRLTIEYQSRVRAIDKRVYLGVPTVLI
ncbi:MAG: hypothetical protein HQM00_07415 [Magnetococcales bacterium]|nr:hypothetical protein [Magnetococcales bacterium]